MIITKKSKLYTDLDHAHESHKLSTNDLSQNLIVTFTSIEKFSISDLNLTNSSQLYPFLEPAYLQLFHDSFHVNAWELKVFIGDDQLVQGYFERIGSELLLLGMKPVLNGQEITDYGDLIYSDYISKDITALNLLWDKILAHLSTLGITNLRLDYVRSDSPTYSALSQSRNNIEITKQEVAPYINLKNDFQTHLEQINKKDRQELQRKLRRLASVPYLFLLVNDPSKFEIEEFIRLLRLSDINKDKFMSEPMAEYFKKLIALKLNYWKIKLAFLKIEAKYAAAIMIFDNGKEILGYNSGFDPLFNYYSPGLMLKSLLLKWTMERNYEKFDTLRGSERYKYDLGAVEAQLYKLQIKL